MSNDILLKVCHVNKTFPVKSGMFKKSKDVVYAVNDVSFNVKYGETYGLVGESGCGKSTLSRTILQLTKADSGEIIFKDNDLCKLSHIEIRKRRHEMQMIFQKPFDSLNPRQTVKEIISSPIRIFQKNLSKKEIENKVLKLMEQVGLSSNYIDRFPHEFSGGQRQRIGIARAISITPKLIICDEPVSALDVSIQAQILNLLKDLQKQHKLTYIFISHNLSVVKHMSNRIGVMYLGSIIETGPSTDLYNMALHPYTKALLSAIPNHESNEIKERIILKGDIPSPVNPPKGCLFSTRCEFANDRCLNERPKLSLIDNHIDYKVACFLYQKEGVAI